MKKPIAAIIAAAVLGASALVVATPSYASGQAPVDPSASAATTEVLQWLDGLTDRDDSRVVIGQYITRNQNNTSVHGTASSAWAYYYEDLASVTGKYPGIAGFDFSQRRQYGAGPNLPADGNWQAYAKTHSDNGGLLKFMWHASNPWTGDGAWSTIPTGHALAEITTPGNVAYDTWMSWLSALADELQWYEDRGIPILWGPLHEANGSWFWWGQGATADYRAVWQHMYNYLTNVRGLHNLLWNYSPDARAGLSGAVSRYPGNGYVDIISPDMYYTSATSSASLDIYTEFTSSGYDGKVFGWGEIGAPGAPIDNRKYVWEIKSSLPKVAFYMQWMDVQDGVSYSINSNAQRSQVMNEPWIVTRDEVLGDPATIDPAPSITVDNGNAAVAYSGPWIHSSDSAYLNGTKSVTDQAGSTATLQFTGPSVTVMARKLPSGGKVDVYIDSIYNTTVDTYAPTDAYRETIFSKTGLSPGAHTIELKLNGQKNSSSTGYWIGLDAFQYTPGVVDDASQSLGYTGTWAHGAADANYLNATKSVSATASATATLNFTGRGVTIYGRTLPAGGKFDVRIDGVHVGTVDTYDAFGDYRLPLLDSAALAYGPHSLEIVVTGTKNPSSSGAWVGLDYIAVE